MAGLFSDVEAMENQITPMIEGETNLLPSEVGVI